MSQQHPNSESHQNPSSTELAAQRTDLAKFRSRAAADRTLMAWMRTSLSLIGFGFGIPTVVKTIEKTRVGHNIDPEQLSIILGLAFITVGSFGMFAALRAHYYLLKQIAAGTYTYDQRTFNATSIAALALLLIGLVSFVGVLVQAIK
ncbi:MAG: DUF202 domain-containing protein [Waterburya sp.]